MAISSVPTHSRVSASQREQVQEIWGSRVGWLVFIFNLLTIQNSLGEALSSLCSLMWEGFHYHCEKHHSLGLGSWGEYIKKMTVMKMEKLGRRYI